MKTPDGSAIRVLVVEDEPAISDACRRILTAEGFKVDTTVNGKIAQDRLEKKEYDLCLIDIRMPTMNGKELYLWLQERHPRLARRVIFTTGDVMSGDAQVFLEQAAMPFLLKPFTPDELRTMLKQTSREVE